MTWAELHGALRGRGLIRADDGAARGRPPSAPSPASPTIRARSTPGQVFVALKGLHADGTAFARQAIERGAVAIVSEDAAPRRRRTCRGRSSRTRASRSALLAAAFYRDPERARCA